MFTVILYPDPDIFKDGFADIYNVTYNPDPDVLIRLLHLELSDFYTC